VRITFAFGALTNRDSKIFFQGIATFTPISTLKTRQDFLSQEMKQISQHKTVS
jgi:hypothetical protein